MLVYHFVFVGLPQGDPLQFPAEPDVVILSQHLIQVHWLTPMSPGNQHVSPFMVYALFWTSDRKPGWRLCEMTFDSLVEVRGQHKMLQGIKFLLLAISQDGIHAKAFPVYPASGKKLTVPHTVHIEA